VYKSAVSDFGLPADESPRRHGDVAHYLYVADLIQGRRVLEVGCGDGYGAQFLAHHGATSVLAIDRSPELIAIAKSHFALANLEFRVETPSSLAAHDDEFDCVFVSADADVLRRAGALAELRRVLSREGFLVLRVRSADRRGANGGASYFETIERLEPMFAPVRMVAQAPLFASTLIEFGDDEDVPVVEVDTTLCSLESDEPSDYVAVCGGTGDEPMRGLTVVQVPLQAVEVAPQPLEAFIDDDEITGEISADLAESLTQENRELRRQLDIAANDYDRAESEAAELRDRVGVAEQEIGRVVAEAGTEVRAAKAELTALRQEVGERQPVSDEPSMSEQIAVAFSAHAEEAKNLTSQLAEQSAYNEELEADLDKARAELEASEQRYREALLLSERLRAEMHDWRDKANHADGVLMRARAGLPGEPQAAGLDVVPEATGIVDVDPTASELPELANQLFTVEAALTTQRDLLRQIEVGLEALAEQAANGDSTATTAWAAEREQQLSELAGELGMKDAEITLLHVGVGSLRQRLRNVLAEVKAVCAMEDRPTSELIAKLEDLSRRLAALS
jgi:predicted O-methyltransferase YrrM